MPLTIGQTIGKLHESVSDYIEAAYHIGAPTLVAQRRHLLNQPGVIHQRPYIESTPRYKTGKTFAEIKGLDRAIVESFALVSTSSNGAELIIHDPPFDHQEQSIEETLVNNKSLVIMTGTGSGKTECFLLPILGKLLREAAYQPTVFRDFPATRAIILYPMNALVNDQLGRLRLLFGDERIVRKFMESTGRPARFARYTSRTLYPGVRTAQKDRDRLTPFANYYVNHLLQSLDPSLPQHETSKKLVDALKECGKWPAKRDLVAWYGRKGSRWQDSNTGVFRRCVTLPGDSELLTRNEVQENPPDILMTNYSMLEYMLMRPIERPIFDHRLLT